MKYAQTGTVEFRDDDGDILVLRSEPTGSQYDQRTNIIGSMKIPGNLIDENTDMESLFAGGELVEVSVDKKELAEFQFKSIFVSMTISGRTVTKTAEAIGIYRKLDRASKEWIDKQTDSVWRAHEESVKQVEKSEGECDASPESSSADGAHLVDASASIPSS